MPPRGRTPTPDEAALLTTYLDAERYLLGSVSREVGDVADVADAGGDTDARTAAGMRKIRADAEAAFRGLEQGSSARVERVIAAGQAEGVAAATRELGQITGRGSRLADYGDAVNRGALDRLAASVVDQLGQAHESILRVVPDAYREAVARTVSGVLVGAQTRREAAQRALWSLTDRGLTGFTDAAGRRWKLSSYVEMATRSASARAAVDAQLDRLGAAGHELVRVSNAPRECDKCAPWEGKILLRGGGSAGRYEFEHATNDGEYVTVDVAGSVDDARRAGLLHPNCRHSLSVYLPGVSPAMAPEPQRADPEGYSAGQRQREIERNIRAWKDRRTAAIGERERRAADRKVRDWQAKMRDHLAENPQLKRLRYRESPGAGNLPTESLRARVGRDGPTPTLVRGRDRKPSRMIESELERETTRAVAAGDMDRFDELSVELDKRDARRARRQAATADQAERRGQHFDELLEQGADYEEAVETAYGVSIEAQRRRRAIDGLRDSGYTGKGFDDLSRAAYRDHLAERYRDAEDATNGYMTNRAATARGVDPASLFSGPESRARANASDELLEWFDQNGRPTLEEFRAELLDDGEAARRLRSGRGDFFT
ncbi:phage minor capsid protein [Pseudonocardia sp. McavD-2-B]|uniref:phage minor capsid protein n=1 Tax=Pseudonocardia sp. McavD-2-B TaxID=2954499 RepID=UPI00209857A1|nr:phage minor capsid protein [Pseudonocardia sp. McavD-2-B]MCO7195394.1 phage minor capsid protein [Pseudonocardia sp. McavD-2-B]